MGGVRVGVVELAYVVGRKWDFDIGDAFPCSLVPVFLLDQWRCTRFVIVAVLGVNIT